MLYLLVTCRLVQMTTRMKMARKCRQADYQDTLAHQVWTMTLATEIRSKGKGKGVTSWILLEMDMTLSRYVHRCVPTKLQLLTGCARSAGFCH